VSYKDLCYWNGEHSIISSILLEDSLLSNKTCKFKIIILSLKNNKCFGIAEENYIIVRNIIIIIIVSLSIMLNHEVIISVRNQEITCQSRHVWWQQRTKMHYIYISGKRNYFSRFPLLLLTGSNMTAHSSFSFHRERPLWNHTQRGNNALNRPL
jgi:hypothetical protein